MCVYIMYMYLGIDMYMCFTNALHTQKDIYIHMLYLFFTLASLLLYLSLYIYIRYIYTKIFSSFTSLYVSIHTHTHAHKHIYTSLLLYI